MSRKLAGYLRAPLPQCSIIVDRHMHKNGGSTLRQIFMRNELLDDWLYWGYGLAHTTRVVEGLLEVMLGASNRSCDDWTDRPALRLAAELHYSYQTTQQSLASFGPRSPLQHLASRCGCKLVLFTRLRRPLEFYVSFYRWAVAWRQRLNASLYGSSMLEWAPRNLQAALLLTSFDATYAEKVGVRARGPESLAKRAAFLSFEDDTTRSAMGKFGRGRVLGASRRALLRRVLRSFDLVGLVERFDETLLLLADMTGLQRLLYVPTRPQTTGPRDQPMPTLAQICPDRAACDGAISQRAPVDVDAYDEATRRFEQLVAAQGAGFGVRLRQMRDAQRAWRATQGAAEHRTTYLKGGVKGGVKGGGGGAGGLKGGVREAKEAGKEAFTRDLVLNKRRQLPNEVAGDERRCALWRGAPLPARWTEGPSLHGVGAARAALDVCRHVIGETPFDLGSRYTEAACCAKLKACLLPPPDPNRPCRPQGACGAGCVPWRHEASRAARAARRAQAVAGARSRLCEVGCAVVDTERRVLEAAGVPYVEAAAMTAATATATATTATATAVAAAALEPSMRAPSTAAEGAAEGADQAGCVDAAPNVPWITPWPDFEGCRAEAAAPATVPLAEALGSGCAKEAWLRVNCRASCGLCNLSLVEALRLEPPAALAAARNAAAAAAAAARNPAAARKPAAVGRRGRVSWESARARFERARSSPWSSLGKRRGRGRGRGLARSPH